MGAVVPTKHLGEFQQASMLKSGSISKQQKGSIFSIWFAPLGHSLSHSHSCWEQSCILTSEHLWRLLLGEDTAPLPALQP